METLVCATEDKTEGKKTNKKNQESSFHAQIYIENINSLVDFFILDNRDFLNDSIYY